MRSAAAAPGLGRRQLPGPQRGGLGEASGAGPYAGRWRLVCGAGSQACVARTGGVV